LYQINWNNKYKSDFTGSRLRYFFFGIPLKSYLCWGKEIFAPCDGRIIKTFDGIAENKSISIYSHSSVRKYMKLNLKKAKVNLDADYLLKDMKINGYQNISGNFIIMECNPNVYAFFCHMQKGSVKVSEGQNIIKGELLGKVGHTGNSRGPHLHFHLMDSDDLLTANGIPCAFREYEIYQNGKWNKVINGIPASSDRIRVL
jgi:hypothetical protein